MPGRATSETSAFTKPDDAAELVDFEEAKVITGLDTHGFLFWWHKKNIIPAPVRRGHWSTIRRRTRWVPYLQWSRRAIESAAINIRRAISGGGVTQGQQEQPNSELRTPGNGLLEGEAEGPAH